MSLGRGRRREERAGLQRAPDEVQVQIHVLVAPLPFICARRREARTPDHLSELTDTHSLRLRQHDTADHSKEAVVSGRRPEREGVSQRGRQIPPAFRRLRRGRVHHEEAAGCPAKLGRVAELECEPGAMFERLRERRVEREGSSKCRPRARQRIDDAQECPIVKEVIPQDVPGFRTVRRDLGESLRRRQHVALVTPGRKARPEKDIELRAVSGREPVAVAPGDVTPVGGADLVVQPSLRQVERDARDRERRIECERTLKLPRRLHEMAVTQERLPVQVGPQRRKRGARQTGEPLR
jgi:hypothetical protein